MQKNHNFFMLLLLVGAIGLVACKEDKNIMDTMFKSADENMSGMYVYLAADTTTLVTSICQRTLSATDFTGKYEYARIGNNASETSQYEFTWKKVDFSSDGLYINFLANSTQKGTEKLRWGSKSVFEADGKCLTNSLLDSYSMYTSFYAKQGANENWYHSDTTIWEDEVKQAYLAWNMTTYKKIDQDSLQRLKDYFAQDWVKDTIAWYNKTFRETAVPPLANIPDTVRVVKTYADKTVNAYAPRSSVDTIKTRVFIGYKDINTYSLLLARDAQGVNKADLKNTFTSYEKEYYTEKDPSRMTERIDEFANANWFVLSMINTKKFNLYLKNASSSRTVLVEGYKKTYDEAGEVTAGELTISGVKYTLQKK